MKEIQIIRPSDMHLHFREGEMLNLVAPHTARHFYYGLVMPNTTNPPIRTGENAKNYEEQILSATKDYPHFIPVMTIKAYDTDEHLTTPEVVEGAYSNGAKAIKVYPQGATTNSHDAVKDIKKLYPAFEKAEELGMRVCLHGEKPDDEIIALEWERLFYSDVKELYKTFPELRIIFEHITCESTIGFIQDAPDNVAATITAHHALVNFNHLAGGMLRPDLYCKPLLKSPQDQKALRKIMISGNPKFFLGTDSAPHVEEKKYCDHGCAGVYTAPIAMSLYTQIFYEEGELSRLENFSSVFGPRFYGLEIPTEKITVIKEEFIPNKFYQEGNLKINNYWGGMKLDWKVKE